MADGHALHKRHYSRWRRRRAPEIDRAVRNDHGLFGRHCRLQNKTGSVFVAESASWSWHHNGRGDIPHALRRLRQRRWAEIRCACFRPRPYVMGQCGAAHYVGRTVGNAGNRPRWPAPLSIVCVRIRAVFHRNRASPSDRWALRMPVSACLMLHLEIVHERTATSPHFGATSPRGCAIQAVHRLYRTAEHALGREPENRSAIHHASELDLFSGRKHVRGGRRHCSACGEPRAHLA